MGFATDHDHVSPDDGRPGRLLAWAAVSVVRCLLASGIAEDDGSVIGELRCSHPRPCVRVRHGHVVAGSSRELASLSARPNREGRR